MVNVKRINELAKKQKEGGLTEDEKAEQAVLRREYVESVKASLRAQLDNTSIVDEKGNKTPLKKQ